MEELKLLINLVKDLPAMAIWLLVIFYGYKVLIVGSIYGVIRFAIDRLHSWLTTPAEKLVKLEGEINGMTITTNGSHIALLAQLERLRGKGTGIDSRYIHRESVEWLRRAIDEAELRDFEAKKAKEKQA